MLNYTTKIPTTRTLGEIQALLAAKGATAVMVQFDQKQPVALSFRVETPVGERAFRLPANTEGVRKVLERMEKRGQLTKRPLDQRATPEHASRVAWRVLKDWIEAQMAIIEAGMVTLDQVMLPYLDVGGGRSLYDAMLAGRLALPGGKEGDDGR